MSSFYLLISGHHDELLWANIGTSKIWESGKQKLSGVVIDWNLRFREYTLQDCQDLPQRDHQLVCIHHRNIPSLGIELCKIQNNISSHIINELLKQRNILYNLRSQKNYTIGPVSTVNDGLKSLRYLGPKILSIIPPDIKNSGNIEKFTRKIKCWTPKNCPCKLRLSYINF